MMRQQLAGKTCHPQESGKHQFSHLIGYDPKRLILNGDTLRMVYSSVEEIYGAGEPGKGKEYDFVLETEKQIAGAQRCVSSGKRPASLPRSRRSNTKRK